MSVLNFFKNIMTIPEEEEFIEEAMEEEFAETPKKRIVETEAPVTAKRESFSSRVASKNSKTVPFNPSQMQVVIFKPDRFEEVREIADELNAKKTVILNLEIANRDTSRRIIDFLSGVAYANGGDFKKVANSTFMIVPYNVDVSGELLLDEFDESKIYY